MIIVVKMLCWCWREEGGDAETRWWHDYGDEIEYDETRTASTSSSTTPQGVVFDKPRALISWRISLWVLACADMICGDAWWEICNGIFWSSCYLGWSIFDKPAYQNLKPASTEPLTAVTMVGFCFESVLQDNDGEQFGAFFNESHVPGIADLADQGIRNSVKLFTPAPPSHWHDFFAFKYLPKGKCTINTYVSTYIAGTFGGDCISQYLLVLSTQIRAWYSPIPTLPPILLIRILFVIGVMRK